MNELHPLITVGELFKIKANPDLLVLMQALARMQKQIMKPFIWKAQFMSIRKIN
jgi:hypothetical protein